MNAPTWCRQLRPLQLEELDDFITQSGDWSHGLPPAGMEIDYGGVSPGLLLPRICGYPTSTSTPGTRHWATLGELTFGDEAQSVSLLARWVSAFDPAVVAVTAAEDLPVIYDQETVMRWIRSTFRGEFSGGAEQFQFKIDWGNPGNDPTLLEADAQAFADQLATLWAASFQAVKDGNSSVKSHVGIDVSFTEVGVASWLQDVAKNADGSGGDAHQEYPNAWSMYAVGAKPTGSASVSLPYEVACCVTFQTDKRGPSGRGRAYFPCLSTDSLSTGGLFQVNSARTVPYAFGDLFDAVKAATTYVPVVVSMRLKQLFEIKSAEVGLVPDAQRRRRRSQDEGRVAYWTAA